MNIGEINTHQIVRMRENIKSLREQKGWSVKHLSKISGTSEKTIRNIENGRNFGILSLIKLCRIYGIKLPELFGDL